MAADNYHALDSVVVDDDFHLNAELWPQPRGAQEWLEDSETDVCLKCKQPFSCCRRRHHCRRCGFIYCAKCCGRSVRISSSVIPGAQRVCELCFDYESKRAEWEHTWRPFLVEGSVFLKYPMLGKGAPQKCKVRLTDDYQGFVWEKPGGQPLPENFIPLADVVQISSGHGTMAFSNLDPKKPCDANLCFSICSTKRTVDVECVAPPTAAFRNKWVFALECALAFTPRSTPQERKKVEMGVEKKQAAREAAQNRKMDRTRASRAVREKYGQKSP